MMFLMIAILLAYVQIRDLVYLPIYEYEVIAVETKNDDSLPRAQAYSGYVLLRKDPINRPLYPHLQYNSRIASRHLHPAHRESSSISSHIRIRSTNHLTDAVSPSHQVRNLQETHGLAGRHVRNDEDD